MVGGETCAKCRGKAGSEKRNAVSGLRLLPTDCVLLPLFRSGLVFFSGYMASSSTENHGLQLEERRVFWTCRTYGETAMETFHEERYRCCLAWTKKLELKKPVFYTHIEVIFLGFHRTLSLLVAATGIVSKLTILQTSHLKLYLLNNRCVKEYFI